MTHVQFATRFAVDSGKRTITGVVVPFGPTADKGGARYRFTKGALTYGDDLSRLKLLVDHDVTRPVGVCTSAAESDEGMTASFRVGRGPRGDEALALAEDGVLDGLSVGVDITEFDDADGVTTVTAATWRETSLTAMPAFTDARVTSVAASADTPGDNDMPESAPAAQAVDLSTITTAIRDGFASVLSPREVVPSGGRPAAVREPAPYRFDGTKGAHEFSTDVFAVARHNDGEAHQRLTKFMAEQFAVATTDVNEVNPARTVGYVDQLAYSTPIWSTINKGGLSDSTPFILPAFNSSANLVAAHVEGTEPNPLGAYTTTSQTITPSALSGKVEVTREVIDAGGSPQVSGLIWGGMQRAYSEALEAAAVTLLNACNPTTITLTAGGVDEALEGEITAALASLQYIRGGNRFNSGTFVQIDLYKKLVAAVDNDGRKLFPVLGATNATGTVAADFSSLLVGGMKFIPAWALAATGNVPASSFMFNTESVHGWASAPRRLDFEYRVALVDIAVWGFVATAVTRLADVREWIYDPVA